LFLAFFVFHVLFQTFEDEQLLCYPPLCFDRSDSFRATFKRNLKKKKVLGFQVTFAECLSGVKRELIS